MLDSRLSFRINKYTKSGKRNKNYELHAYLIKQFIISLGYPNPKAFSIGELFEEEI
jgi:hypothetical protein